MLIYYSPGGVAFSSDNETSYYGDSKTNIVARMDNIEPPVNFDTYARGKRF